MTDTSNPNVQNLRTLLAGEHARLERLFDDLLAAVRADARVESAQLWSEFDASLLAHMQLEERHILPSFALAHQTEAECILAEHAQIRSTLIELGVGVDLHFARADIVERFIALLRAHAQREDALLYAWSQEHLGPRERATILDRILARIEQMPAQSSS